ncbi:hypothetical protein LCGC14_0575620 [marine sediment metagenome]|uniref:Uncharacterized protein n=1 Tax=marine sediment metagenome TaxID=412755 RepID=A0A0F9RMV5_9ZZZZ
MKQRKINFTNDRDRSVYRKGKGLVDSCLCGRYRLYRYRCEVVKGDEFPGLGSHTAGSFRTVQEDRDCWFVVDLDHYESRRGAALATCGFVPQALRDCLEDAGSHIDQHCAGMRFWLLDQQLALAALQYTVRHDCTCDGIRKNALPVDATATLRLRISELVQTTPVPRNPQEAYGQAHEEVKDLAKTAARYLLDCVCSRLDIEPDAQMFTHVERGIINSVADTISERHPQRHMWQARRKRERRERNSRDKKRDKRPTPCRNCGEMPTVKEQPTTERYRFMLQHPSPTVCPAHFQLESHQHTKEECHTEWNNFNGTWDNPGKVS